MKKKAFCPLLAVMFAVFAALSSGGCGGGSDNPSVSNSSGVLDMGTAMDYEDIAQEIVDRIVSEDLILLGLAEAKIYNLSVSGDGEIWAEDISFTSDVEAPSRYDPDTFAQHYLSGDIILLEEADPDFINKIRGDVGEVSEDSKIAGASGSLEVYAMSRRKLGEAMSTYTYAVQRVEDMVGSSELESAYTVRNFVVDRWTEFFTWIAAISLVTDPVYSAEFRASEAADLTAIADLQQQTFDFSYASISASVTPSFNPVGSTTLEFSRSRMNSLGFDIRAAHSFTTHKDYYFVRANLSTTPKNIADITLSPWGNNGYRFNYLYGYTHRAGFEAWLNNGEGVTLAASIPAATINDGASSSEDLSYDISGAAGAKKLRFGRKAEDGLNYSASLSWAPSGYNLLRKCGAHYPASAGWTAEFKFPQKGEQVLSDITHTYYKLNAYPASTKPLEYSTSWVWEVDPSQWKANPQMTMNIDFEATDGMSHGETTLVNRRVDTGNYSFSNFNNASIVLNAPPHVVLDTDDLRLATNLPSILLNAAFTKLLKMGPPTYNLRPVSNDAHTADLKILADDDWTLSVTYSSASSDWVRLSETSGSATGDSAKTVQVEIDANPTPNDARMAYIVLKSGNDSEAMQISQATLSAVETYFRP